MTLASLNTRLTSVVGAVIFLCGLLSNAQFQSLAGLAFPVVTPYFPHVDAYVNLIMFLLGAAGLYQGKPFHTQSQDAPPPSGQKG